MSDDVEAITGEFVGTSGAKFTASLVNHQIKVHYPYGADLTYEKEIVTEFVRRGTWMRP